jgi:phosphatidylinositol alpha-1,6-mannosyltransferase
LSSSVSATVGQVTIMAAAPFQVGGIERLTWSVFDALSEQLGPSRVGMVALVGPSEEVPLPNDPRMLYRGPSRLTLRSKIRFATRGVLRTASRGRPAFLCLHVNQAQVAMVARLLYRTPYAVWAHGSEVWSPMQPLPLLALRGADLVLCSSEYTRTQVVNRQGVQPTKTLAIRPPISRECSTRAAAAATSAAETTPVILSVGRVSVNARYKGYDTVIRALPRIARQTPSVRYRIVGPGDGYPVLASLAERTGVAEHVDLIGPVDDERLWQEFEGARVFALPSRSGRGDEGEGLGISYVEAAAFARPVVASRARGAAEAVVDGVTGRVVDPDDVEQVASALLPFLLEPSEAERMGVAGRERVLAEFAPDVFAKRLLASLREAGIVSGSSPRP